MRGNFRESGCKDRLVEGDERKRYKESAEVTIGQRVFLMPDISDLNTKASLVPDSRVLDETTASPADVDCESLRFNSTTAVGSILILGVDVLRERPKVNVKL